MSYDVIVAGGGPAGSTLASDLAREGLRVLLLEKGRYPRSKPCGGGLSPRAVALLDFPWQEVLEDTTRIVDFHHGPDRRIRVENTEPVAYLVMRDRFDQLLADRAVSLGAELRQESMVTGVRPDAGGVTVEAGGETFRAAFLACADGVNSTTAHRTGLYGSRKLGITLAAELAASPADLERFRGSVVIDSGVCPGGYGWIFPKQRQLSVGLGSFDRTIDVRAALARFVGAYGLADAPVLHQTGHLLVADGQKRRVWARDRVLLTGEAAGLVDPLTGEGILYALLSAKLASRAILTGWNGPSSVAPFYHQLVDREIRRQLVAAKRLARLYYAFPTFLFGFGEAHQELAVELVEAVARGRDYASIGWDLAGLRGRKETGEPEQRANGAGRG